MRLNRFLASAGLGSRRGVEKLIVDGHVTINGDYCLDLATTVLPTDSVKVDGRLVKAEPMCYLLLNKPKGFLCTADDEKERRTIFDLIPDGYPRLFNVGRLDKESEGLLILTNDGELAQFLTHPSHGVEKEYEVILDQPFDPAKREKLLRGFHIEGGRAKMESLAQLGPQKLKVVLKQGLKRQIRLMFYDLGYEVEQLTRIRIGPLKTNHLPLGGWRMLTAREVESLRKEPKPKTAWKPAATAAPAKPVAKKINRLDAKPPRKGKSFTTKARKHEG
ncbi:MAG: pseudouridine synthase [Chthoniobacteraceae bacterium]